MRFTPFAFAFAALILVWWYHDQLFNWLISSWWAAPVSSFIYFLIGPAQFLNGRHFDRLKRDLSAAEAAAGLVSTRGV